MTKPARASLALVVALAAVAAADEPKDRVSTTARGRASVPADEVSIELTVAASAEEAADAEKKYNAKLAQVLAALGKGDPKDLPTEARRRRRKAEEEAKPEKKKKPAAASEDEDDDEETPKRPARRKRAADPDDEDAPPKKDDAKPGKKDDKKADAADDKKSDDKKVDDKKSDDKKVDDKKSDDKKVDDKKSDDKKLGDSPIAFEVKEGAVTFGIRHVGDPNQIRMRRMMNQPGQKEEPEIRFASTITITLKDIAKIDVKAIRHRFAEIVDTATQAGADLGVGADGEGVPAIVRFRVGKPEQLKLKAYEDAMHQARDRAAEIAKFANREIGRVLVIRDNTQLPQGVRQSIQPYTNPYQYVQFAKQQGEDVTTEITFECDVYVEFELK
jgi:uncharacterized protein YggE